MVRLFLAALALVTAFASVTTCDVGPSPDWAIADDQPDPRRAVELDRWPNDADLNRLHSVEGKSKAVVLRVLGHPCRVERRPGGEEVWEYPWCASCRVWIRKGVCTGTDYIGGY